MVSFPHCDIVPSDAFLWVHVALLSVAGIIVVSSFFSQVR
jgi:hypothetical protein